MTEPRRATLTRDRVLAAAIGLADTEGVDAVSMRRVGQALGVEAMSLYHHVRNKDALLNGMIDLLIGQLNETLGPGEVRAGSTWRETLRTRILTARTHMLAHPWVPGLLASRTTVSPAMIQYYEQVLAILIAGGFSYDLAHHTLHALGSNALGFTQELFNPGADVGQDDFAPDLAAMAEHFPHMVAMLAEADHSDEGMLGWCDDQAEFEFSLDVLLDGLVARLAT
ncbi:TetR/AcrR family transcriptional regulator [Ammonicoccus fulvus]|uniref:TetR/AcrR family transcriptional regulator n=1 Tax=Ammonicoccus fulvus TaxID=3138240 RepID=A0ABZ3FTK8_9ACTN